MKKKDSLQDQLDILYRNVDCLYLNLLPSTWRGLTHYVGAASEQIKKAKEQDRQRERIRKELEKR